MGAPLMCALGLTPFAVDVVCGSVDLLVRSPTINDSTVYLMVSLRALPVMHVNYTDLIDHLSIAYLSRFSTSPAVTY
ncbi:hypothetical protein [Vulcanisaeta sp. JCM 16161]|uniref:hypothetical protein n=1 Tax=Vulcanisaeta sp. JCM 16161 TaxID=1295372 RepID=UPI000AF551F2|nr:hypothetical protein [Vulcanisaeta sp. JCM 16161]